VVEVHKRFLGKPLRTLSTNGTEDCSVLCKHDPSCSHWTYLIATKECSLQSEYYGEEPDTEWVSGTRCEGISPPKCMYTNYDPEYLHCEQKHWLRYDLQNLDGQYACPVLSKFAECLAELHCSQLLPAHLTVFRAESCSFAFCEQDLKSYQGCVQDFNNAQVSPSDSVSCDAIEDFENCITICDLTNYQQSLKDDCDNHSQLSADTNEDSSAGSVFVMMLAIVLSSILICLIMCYLAMYRKRKSTPQVGKRRPENKVDPAYRSTSVQIGSRHPYSGGRSESMDILGRPKKDALGRPKRRPEKSGEPAWKRQTVERSDSAMSARQKKDPGSSVGNDAASAGTSTPLAVNTTGTETVELKFSETSLASTPSMGGDKLRSDTHV